MKRVVLLPVAAAELLKAHVDQYTRADGTVVQAHDDKRQAAQPAPPPLGAHAAPAPAAKQPKDFAAGANVYFPHPQKPGKQALGKFVGKSGDKSIVEHPQFGKLAFDHGHVKAARGVPGGSKTTAPAKPAAADITKHPQYHPADHEYLKGKGWSDDEIRERWDAEQKAGLPPMSVNKHKPPSWTENASPTGSGVKPGPAARSPFGNAQAVSHKGTGKTGMVFSTSGDGQRHDVKWSNGEKSSHHHSELSKVDDR